MPVIKHTHDLDAKVARWLDMMIGIYFTQINRDPSIRVQTLGEFIITSKSVYPQYVLDWMEEKD